MDSIDLNAIYESYRQIYEDVEELDEANRAEREFKLNEPEKLAARNTSSEYYRVSPKDPNAPGRFRAKGALHAADQEKRRKKHKERRGVKESYDHYDIVLEYLLDEGLCESVENAEIMMAHMSESWIDSILDEAKVDNGLSVIEKEKVRRERGNRITTHVFNRNRKKTPGAKKPELSRFVKQPKPKTADY
jgi:hypothetical protein